MIPNLNTYTELRIATYDVFDKKVLPYVKSLASGSYTFKELTLLFQMKVLSSRSLVRASDLSLVARMSPSSLSNHLKRFLQKKLIEKNQSTEDRRIYYLSLTPKGESVLAILDDFYREINQTITKSFSPLEMIRIVKSSVAIANAFSKESPLKFKAFKVTEYQSTLQRAITRFYSELIYLEETLLKSHHIDLTLKEWYVIVEVYMASQNGPVTLSQLQETIKLSMSTTSTLVTRLSRTFLRKTHPQSDKRITHIHVQKKWHAAIDAFIALRLASYERIASTIGEKDLTLFLRLFSHVGQMIEAHTNTDTSNQ